MKQMTNNVNNSTCYGYAGPVGGGRSKEPVEETGPPGCQSPLNGLGKKIFWGGMTLAEIFAFAGAAMACKTEIEYVDREVIKEVEVIKPQRPTFGQIFYLSTNISTENKARLISAYDALDTDYVVGLKYNHVSPVGIKEEPSNESNTIKYDANMIRICGTVNDADFTRLFKSAIDSYKTDNVNKLGMLYNRKTNVLVIAKSALNQKVRA